MNRPVFEVPRSLHDEIVADAWEDTPSECCDILAGDVGATGSTFLRSII